jgi:hypothetical protein
VVTGEGSDEQMQLVCVLTETGAWDNLRCCRDNLASHPFWGDDPADPPTNLPAQPVYDNLVRNLEKARSHQIELASMLEFGVVLDASTMGGADTSRMLLPPAVGNTPIRPAPASKGGQSSTSDILRDNNSVFKGAFPGIGV